MQILIVEDDPVVALYAADILEAAGHGVIGPAYSVEDADMLIAIDSPELAIVDINLAGGDEGVALARRLKAEHRIPSIFVSGQIAAARANKDAALGLLRKPYDMHALLASIPIAQALLAGGHPPPPTVPSSLEVFS